MPDSGWFQRLTPKLGFFVALVFAVVAIVWGWNYGLQQERIYEQEARQAHADHTKNGCNQVAKTEVQRTPIKEPDGIPCTPAEKAQQENDNRRDYADLVAQRSSALWAKIMGIAALIGMGLSFVGVGLVWTTFRETQKANEIARDQQRPWLEIDMTFDFASRRKEGLIIACNVILKNIGQTPAQRTRIFQYIGNADGNAWSEMLYESHRPIEDDRIYNTTHVVLPQGSAQDQELFFINQHDETSGGTDGVRPQVMITVLYTLPNGKLAQTSAWFRMGQFSNSKHRFFGIPWMGERSIPHVDILHMGYVRVT